MKSKKIKINLLAFFLLINLVLTSCSIEWESEEPLTYTIEGHLYEGCEKNPVSNFDLELFRNDYNGQPSGGDAGVVQTITTDSNGHYKFRYIGDAGVNMAIRHKAGYGYNYLFSSIPLKNTYKDLDVFFKPMINYEVHLKVVNEYSKYDTLFIQDFKTDGYKLPGPFKSGFLFRTDSVRLFKMSFDNNYYSLNYFMLPYKGGGKAVYFGIEDYCDNVLPVTIVLD